jgi:OOP family OmpA-OmpF porin
VPDDIDRCLNTPAQPKIKTDSRYAVLFSTDELSDDTKSIAVDAEGCALDSDSDSVADYLDYCPHNTPLEISAGVTKNGCARQSDKDGTPDYRDRCPDTAFALKTDHHGCPVLK